MRIALLLAAMPALGVDLDIGVTPGNALDWLESVPSVAIVSDRGRIPDPPKDAGSGTRMSGEEPACRELLRPTTLYGYLRVRTADLPWEIPFIQVPKEGSPDTVQGAGTRFAYPPRLTPDVYWLAMAPLCRRLLHPACTSESEVLQYLLTLGEPAAAVAALARQEGMLKGTCEQLVRWIDPIPAALPKMKLDGASVTDQMYYRLVVEDLIRGYPYAMNTEFASRIRLLGDEIVPHVIRASEDDHPFLRRNATFYLGRFADPRALERLRAIFAKSPDPVCRNRALEGLVRQNDAQAAPLIIQRLDEETDTTFIPFLLHALGWIGGEKAESAVLRKLKAHRGVYDVLVAGLIALGRLGSRSREVEDFLDTWSTPSLRDPDTKLEVLSKDPRGTRKRTVDQCALAAQAIYGSPKARRALLALLAAPPESEEDRIRARRYGATKGWLGAIEPSAVHFVMEALASWAEGREALQKVMDDPHEDESLRAYALVQFARWSAGKELVANLVSLGSPTLVAERAMGLAFSMDAAAGIRRAQHILAQYTPTMSPEMKYLVLSAIRHLGPVGKADRDVLLRIVRKELALRLARGAPSVVQAPNADIPEPRPHARPSKGLPSLPTPYEESTGTPDLTDPKKNLWAEFSPAPALLEHALIEFGRASAKDDSARQAVLAVLDEGANPARGEACLALGAIGTPAAWERLAQALEDPDGWVRLMAYRALRQGSGIDAPVDWLGDDETGRAQAKERYLAWVRTLPPSK